MDGNGIVWNATWREEKSKLEVIYKHLCCFVFHIISIIERSGRFIHMPGPNTGVREPQRKSQPQKLGRNDLVFDTHKLVRKEFKWQWIYFFLYTAICTQLRFFWRPNFLDSSKVIKELSVGNKDQSSWNSWDWS